MCPIFFEGHPLNFKVTRDKYPWFWAELRVSRLSLQFQFTDGFEMIPKAWSSIKEVLYCLSRSSIKFQGHTRQKIAILTQIERFWIVTAVWIHQWVWNNAQSLMLYRRGALLFFEVIHQIWRSLVNRKIDDLNPILSKITGLVPAIKSLRFALLIIDHIFCITWNELIEVW